MIFAKILILFLLSAFFSGSEAAITSLSDYKLRKIYNKHRLFRNVIKLWLQRPHRLIITILLGNTVVNLILSSYSAKLFTSLPVNLPLEVKEIIIWLFITTTIIIFSELIPKIVCKTFPEKVSKVIFLPIYILQFFVLIIFLPVFFIIERVVKLEETTYFTKIDAVKKIISDSFKTIFHQDITEIFDRAIRFNEVRVKDIMTPRNKVDMINISNKNISTLIEDIIETGRTRVPLYDGSEDKIVGFAMVKDVFYLCSTGVECSTYDLIHPILEFNANLKAKDAMKEFKQSQIHIAKVVDNNKKFLGVITLEDIIEEVVGDILDEYDVRRGKN